jgi:ribosomal protein L37AE/L43A
VNELRLEPLTCPQCGAPGVVRQGTRITECGRCGARLCLTEVAEPRYEAVANLGAAEALNAARAWLERRAQAGILARPELVLIPFHEIVARRIGVYERRVPERRRVYHKPRAFGSPEEPIETFEYFERDDTKVMVSDVQSLAPAAHAPWDLIMFDAQAARRSAQLRAFDLVEAQRHATVYAEEATPLGTSAERFAAVQGAELVAVSRRTLFFPFWSLPVHTKAGSYEVVLEAIGGDVVAWHLPAPYPTATVRWLLPAVAGALALGQGLRGLLLGAAPVDPVLAIVVGVALVAVAAHLANHADWAIRSWPEPGTIPRLEREA